MEGEIDGGSASTDNAWLFNVSDTTGTTRIKKVLFDSLRFIENRINCAKTKDVDLLN